ncbi:hypothetical protein O9G_006413 [Rozella allomycis CSF55]|uniref:Uncharacterized protein n=1 Tax=Rozella allomycis (strain CSF55) TaxID=988480 RepID=A0A075B062_ROZAC|nr:hypothetical protein O9G_006413 [Rozella allomycis CSF55]|eukprot:EPZ35914.1 hypothetical protein O9G_006413 [Rozella allomycis CSF55]
MEKLESVVFDFGNDLNFSFKKEFLLYRNYDQDVVKKAIKRNQYVLLLILRKVPVTVGTGCIGGHAIMY